MDSFALTIHNMREYPRYILFITILSFSFLIVAQHSTMYVSGKILYDICGTPILLRGVNYAPFDWGANVNSDNLKEIEKTGANCVRLVWYVNSKKPEYTVANLDTIIARCARNKMIPILELHDQTCSDDEKALMELARYLTRNDVAEVLQKHKEYIIVNIANEALKRKWTGFPGKAVQRYINVYSQIIRDLRANNFEFPLMIDAPDCGQDITIFDKAASSLMEADTRKNLIFSAHAYWYYYAGNNLTRMEKLITNTLYIDYPIVIGEFANYQDDSKNCQYKLDYSFLLQLCEQYDIPWLAWSWDNDNCELRRMSTDGTFESLSEYGNDIVNNPVYGLKSGTFRSPFLLHKKQCISVEDVELIEEELIVEFKSYPSSDEVIVFSNCDIIGSRIVIYDISGRLLKEINLEEQQSFSSKDLKNGVYLIEVNKMMFLYKK